MSIRKNKANSNTRTNGGFSVVELLVTAVVLTVVTSAGVMGITRARASVRLAGAAREFGAYLEKARIQSIRSHADDATERATIAISDDKTSYTVTMDLDGDGDLDTKTIALPDGVTFEDVETIAFDWRGRTMHIVGASTEPNAQVFFILKDSYETVSIDVTGSGDITMNSAVLEDEVPNVTLEVDDLATATPTPTVVEEIPTPTPTPDAVATPDNTANPDPTPLPTPDLEDIIPVPTPTPEAKPTPSATPTPRPTPDVVPTPTPAPAVCTLTTDKVLITMSGNGSTKVKVGHNAGVPLTVIGTSSDPSNLQINPDSLTVASGSTGEFIIKAKRTFLISNYTVTFSTSCGTKAVSVIVAL
jgi:Tfp pilus assembly protein FimT